MAHEIDMSNDRANVAYVNEVPWHGLGFQLPDGAGIDEWKSAAGLDWSAVSSQVLFKSLTGEVTPMTGREVLFRSDTGLPLSVVSARYQPVQPPQVLEFFRDLAGELGGFKMETAGSLRGGRKIWALAAADNDLVFGGKKDVVKRYLLLATSFDQSVPTIVQQTSVRVVCNNTLTAAVDRAGAEAHIRVSHLTAFDGNAVKKRLALDSQWKEFGQAIKKLIAKKVSDKAATEYFLDTFYPQSMRKTPLFSEKGARRRVDELMDVYYSAPGQKLATAQGTSWGLLNAVTYFMDHQVRSRSQDVRLDKAWFGDGALIKTRAFENALAFAAN